MTIDALGPFYGWTKSFHVIGGHRVDGVTSVSSTSLRLSLRDRERLGGEANGLK